MCGLSLAKVTAVALERIGLELPRRPVADLRIGGRVELHGVLVERAAVARRFPL
jgi:hypothetical protein